MRQGVVQDDWIGDDQVVPTVPQELDGTATSTSW
jgi:hypothetical protein